MAYDDIEPVHDLNPHHNTTDDPWIPPAWQCWFDLYEIAPDLKSLHPIARNNARPPREMSDLLFLNLCRCFSVKRKREILRALILDLLADDILDILQEPERSPEK